MFVDKGQFQSLVLWLEEQKIRHYQVSDRDELRKIGNDRWQSHYEVYLKSLGCHYTNNNVQALCWLLGKALHLETDGPDKQIEAFSNIDSKYLFSSFFTYLSTKYKTNFFHVVQSVEFADGIDKVCEALNIPPHPDPLVRLEACHKLLESRIGFKMEKDIQSVKVNLDEHDFGFSDKTMDPVLLRTAKILRMLHLQQLRKLQSDVNNTIELVQGVTANPKTDTKLGKVGR